MKSPIRILAIDGGGVGGIMPARLLDRLHSVDPRIIEQADIVAGTSTGGLIALGLACGKAPAELCELYRQQAKNIFSRSNRRFLFSRLYRAKFSTVGLRDAVTAIVGDKRLGELTAKHVVIPVTAIVRPDASHRPAGVFLSTAFRLTNNQVGEKYSSSKWKCVDVAIATAAAPTYFPAHEVVNPAAMIGGKYVCWDGGIVANNPALAATGEVFRLELLEKSVNVRAHQSETPDVRVLSLGTGYRNIDINGGDWGLLQTARPLVGALLDASVGSTAFLIRQVLGQRAIRVSIPLKEDYSMDDPSAIERLEAEAIDFAEHGISSIQQPDGTTENLSQWLNDYWY